MYTSLSSEYDYPELSFYKNKSVQYSYNYKLWIDDTPDINNGTSESAIDTFILNNLLHQWTIVEVTMSNYKFDRQSTEFGVVQRSFVTLPKEQNLNISVTMEEDSFGNIAKLIALLQQKIISPKGFYIPPNKQYLRLIILEVYDNQGFIIGQYEFNNALFMGADDVNRSYSSGDAIKYNLNFGVDRIKYTHSFDIEQYNSIVPISKRVTNRAIAAARRAAAIATPSLGMKK